MYIQGHISQKYEKQLSTLKDSVLTMGKLVEDQFDGATKSLLQSNVSLAKKISVLDYKIDEMEIDIDESCTKIIATRQPKANDLRSIFTVIKIVTDLERIGDESEKIAKFASKMKTNTKTLTMYKSLEFMVDTAKQMITDSLDCYACLDVQKALAVTQQDLEIDRKFEYLNRLMSTYVLENTKHIEDILKVSWCSRSIERVGDHAKNICEYIVYMVGGKDIRHTRDK